MFKGKIKTPAVLLLLGLLAAIFFLFIRPAIIRDPIKDSIKITDAVLPDAPANFKTEGVREVNLPQDEVAAINAPLWKMKGYAWAAQTGLLYAIGGTQTTRGSLMDKAGIKISWSRQDDPNVMMAELVAFAEGYKKNQSLSEGIQFFTMMGDGAYSTITGGNENLAKLGDEYKAEIIGFAGRSDGEDKFMVPPEWLDNKELFKGGVVAVVPRDGDQNIIFKYCADNNIEINPDAKTWNPHALNMVEAETYITAGTMYITGYSEEREVVKKEDGKITRTNEKKTITVQAVSSWTPVDVTIANKKGGLVTAASTHDYQSQMPCVIIGIKKFNNDNRDKIKKFLTAIYDAGDQVKSFQSVRTKSSQIVAKAFGEKDQDATYWAKYYNIVKQKDIKGLDVELGGSMVWNLGDNLEYWGLSIGGLDKYEIVYNLFSGYAMKMYPEKFLSGFNPYRDVINKSYVREIADNSGTISEPEKQTYIKTDNSTIVASKPYYIEFATNSDMITPEGELIMKDLMNSLLTSDKLNINIFGYTDNVGDNTEGGRQHNIDLSEKRAISIKMWLQRKDRKHFPDSRFTTVEGRGSKEPISSNSTEEGRQRNRRASIEQIKYN